MRIIKNLMSVISILFCHFSLFANNENKNLLGWIEVKPGGNTQCARGEDFSFFFFPGTTNKIVIDYIGGGACWNALTCAEENPTFVDSIEYIREHQRAGLHGVYDKSRHDNPVRDWHHVVIPYCTGDIHWGNNDIVYTKQNGESFTINHRGAVNAKSVFNWVKEHFTNPEKILITGCSAGAYGSIYWLPYFREYFNTSSIYQIADSGAGVVPKDFFKQSFINWQATKEAATWIPEINPEEINWQNITLEDIYSSTGKYYPEIFFSQYSSAHDVVQKFFYEIMGGNPDQWHHRLSSNFNNLNNSMNNFTFFRAPGESHCILPYDTFYTNSNNGTLFIDWFNQYIHDENPQSINCINCS